jgi:hypothetical protein
MNENQIYDLAEFISEGGLHFADIKGSVKTWLEQNPIEPVVVGLSDEQVGYLSFKLHGTLSYDGRVDVIENWLKTQTFTQSESFKPNWGCAE